MVLSGPNIVISRGMNTHIPSHLSDDQLVAELKRVAGQERASTAQVVAHLAEMDARGLHLAAGFSSLFKYCCEILHFSEHETYNRIEVARLARRFPMILELLEGGSVNLTTVRLLATHLTDENHAQLLAAATHLSRREVEELVARHAPKPAVPASVRKIPVRGVVASAASPSLALGPSTRPTIAAPPPPPRRPVVAPLATDRYEVKFTVNAETRDKLRRTQDLLRHAIPTGDLAEIFERALTLLLEDVEQKKLSATSHPRTPRGVAPHSRHIPAAVSRAVWLRDGERCAFVSKDGRRCDERAFLELHHLKPYGALGEATVENIEVRCAAHNKYEAELFYGARKQDDGDRVVREKDAADGEPRRRRTRSETSWLLLHSQPRTP